MIRTRNVAAADPAPEVLAVIMTALAAYGYPAERGYRIDRIVRVPEQRTAAWKKAGLKENMLAREMGFGWREQVWGGNR